MPGPRWWLVVLSGLLVGPAWGEERVGESDAVGRQVAPFFQPYATHVAALSPDGAFLAYDDNTKSEVAIVILGTQVFNQRRFVVSKDRKAPLRVLALRWVSADRLVVTTSTRMLAAIHNSRDKVDVLLDEVAIRHHYAGFRTSPALENRIITPDMAMDGFNLGELLDPGAESTLARRVRAPLAGEFFAQPLVRDHPLALSPRLHQRSPHTHDKLYVELRTDRDPLDDHVGRSESVTVQWMTDLPQSLDSSVPTHATHARLALTAEAPPAVLIEWDVVARRERVLAKGADWLRVLTDRQGRPRLALQASGTRRRFLYRGAAGGAWTPLESVVKDAERWGLTATPENLLGERSVPLGFDYDGESIHFASNVGRDTYGLRVLDLETGAMGEVVVGFDRLDLVRPTDLLREDVLVFDPYNRRLAGVRFEGAVSDTFWLDRRLGEIERRFRPLLPGRRATLVDWDDQRRWFLVEARGADDPGGFYLFDREGGRLIPVRDRAPWLSSKQRSRTETFSCEAKGDAGLVSGMLTLPANPRLRSPAVLVYFHDGPWLVDRPDYNPGVQALAALGFAVLQVNYRGSGGLGRNHLEAIRDRWEHTVWEDVRAALDWCGENRGVDAGRVATLGYGFGGFLAMRAAQLDPERVKCAVALNAPGELEAWSRLSRPGGMFLSDVRRRFFAESRSDLADSSALAAAPHVARPIFFVDTPEESRMPGGMIRALHRAMAPRAEGSALLDLSDERRVGSAEELRTRIFTELGRFFNATIYAYGVEIGPTELVDEPE